MKLADVVKNIIKETAVDLTQQFDRNFERKAFFNQKWPESKHANSRGSMMLRSGDLRRSINNQVNGGMISWKSSLPYASIHNEGGEIEVTAQMKKFFWAMYYKASNAAGKGKTARNNKLNDEATKWKYMALMKVGSKMKIEQRQYIGWHPEVDAAINNIVAYNMERYNDALKNQLKK